MAFLDTLIAAGYAPEANHIKFLHQYKFTDNTVHFFFEGLEDQSYYANYIESTFPEHFILNYYVCDGKANVYAQYSRVNWSVYSKNRVLFFTDKDVDDLVGISYTVDENIFETLYYSIENYLVESEVFKRFLRENCFITDTRVINNLATTFDLQLQNFSQKLIPISAWVIHCRKNSYRVNLSDIDISKIFEISNDFRIEKKTPAGCNHAFDYICKATNTTHFDFGDIRSIIANLKTINPHKKFIRGKYELWFLYAFCKNAVDVVVPKINAEIRKYNSVNTIKATKCKVTVQIKPENIVQLLAPKVRMPRDIQDFLSSNFQKITHA